MKLRNLLLAAAAIALPAAAQAQPVTGWYVGGGVGINQLFDATIRHTPNAVIPNQTSITSDIGFVGLISGGYGFGNGLRMELEGNFRDSTSKLSPQLSKNNSQSGTTQQYGGMVNFLYDFNVGWPVYPYAGAGVGFQWATLSGQGSGTTSTGYMAAQAIGGAAYPIASVPGLSITGEVRFMSAIVDESWKWSRNANYSTQAAPLQNFSALLGLRYAFNTVKPAPAPVAAPAPAPARSYLVFFDWDKADLTARAKQIVAEASDASKKVQTTKIEVNGYADRTGTAAYNKALSMRRAQNVAAEMVKNGVPEKEIFITAFGDTHPLVPTGPGVREPQNRRVEIILK